MDRANETFDDVSAADANAEAKHLAEVIASFRSYAKYGFEDVKRLETHMNHLRERQKALLMPTMEKRLRKQRECVLQNQRVLNRIVEFSDAFVQDTLVGLDGIIALYFSLMDLLNT